MFIADSFRKHAIQICSKKSVAAESGDKLSHSKGMVAKSSQGDCIWCWIWVFCLRLSTIPFPTKDTAVRNSSLSIGRVVGACLLLQLVAGPLTDAVAQNKRVLWTTSKIQGTPDPPSPYQTKVAFPKLRFEEPLAMTVVPGTDQLVVAERWGKIFTFTNDPQTAKKQLLFDIGRMIVGLVLHPEFSKNGVMFVTSILDRDNPSPKGTRLSKFTIGRDRSSAATLKTEQTLLEWSSNGHTGGCLNFGPDGFLYVAVGDGSGIADQLKTGQDISDLEASMLRLDVDRPRASRPYSVPTDNPFVGVKGARPEIWAYGLRQAWRFSFDRVTGDLWAGDVGQDLWEMIHVIKKGSNYGWSIKEATHPFRPERKPGPTPIVPPIVEHPHSDFRSITGGYVYRGTRLADLKGAYIYGDFDTGKIWSLRYRNGKVSDHRELADTQLRIVDFGEDADGEIYLVHFSGGEIHRLVPSPPPPKNAADFPRKLSETGLFASARKYMPAPGLIPYSVVAPLWSDGAKKDRFIALPGKSQIQFDTVVYPQPAPGSLPGWRFPDGTVLVKTFSLELEVGKSSSTRRLETRILHHERMPGKDDEYGAQVWHGYTYVWNGEQTDAVLLDAKGLDRTYTIADPKAPGGKRKQTWHFPSRAECTLCHTMAAKYVLGVSTLQMNKNADGSDQNQLTLLDQLGVFTKPLPADPDELPRLVNYHDTKADVNARARAYLHANCSHCHRKWGGGNAEFQLLAKMPLGETGTLDVKPGQGQFKLDDPRLLVPGDPHRSMVYHRMRLQGLGRMPHIASKLVDEDAVSLIAEWIKQLPAPK